MLGCLHLLHIDDVALLQPLEKLPVRHGRRAGEGLVQEEVEVVLGLRAGVLGLPCDALLKRKHRADEADGPGYEARVGDHPVGAHLRLADHGVDLHPRQAQHGLVQEVADVVDQEHARHLSVLGLEEVDQVLRELVVLELRLQQTERGELLQQIEGKGDELTIRDVAVPVLIDLEHDRVDLTACQPQLHGRQGSNELRLAERAAPVLIHALEDGAHKVGELVARHAVHQQVFRMLLDRRHVLLQALLGVHALNDLQCQGYELLVLNHAVRVHVSL
mmetsp:Transcript_53008/g.119395  ORF Transcript_53008/g.119395 Transcript_53008/m.119395 type:complete len:275 (+) Transcript_53008:301-1125(+)